MTTLAPRAVRSARGVRPREQRVRMPWELAQMDGRYGPPSGYYWAGGAGTIVVDEAGVGGGLLDRLKEQQYRVVGYNGGRASRDKTKFANLRAEAFWTLRKLLEEGRIDLPLDHALWDELTATRWTVDSQGRVALEPKEDLRDRIGRSPDRADSVAMCYWYAHGRGHVPDQRVSTWGS